MVCAATWHSRSSGVVCCTSVPAQLSRLSHGVAGEGGALALLLSAARLQDPLGVRHCTGRRRRPVTQVGGVGLQTSLCHRRRQIPRTREVAHTPVHTLTSDPRAVDARPRTLTGSQARDNVCV